MLAGVTSAEYVEFPGGAGEEPSGGDGAGREEPLVRIHSGPNCKDVAAMMSEKNVSLFVKLSGFL